MSSKFTDWGTNEPASGSCLVLDHRGKFTASPCVKNAYNVAACEIYKGPPTTPPASPTTPPVATTTTLAPTTVPAGPPTLPPAGKITAYLSQFLYGVFFFFFLNVF